MNESGSGRAVCRGVVGRILAGRRIGPAGRSGTRRYRGIGGGAVTVVGVSGGAAIGRGACAGARAVGFGVR